MNITKVTIEKLWEYSLKPIDARRLETSYLEGYINDFLNIIQSKPTRKDSPTATLETFLYWFWHFEKLKGRKKKLVERCITSFSNKNQAWFQNQGTYQLLNLFNHLFFENGEFVSDKRREDYLKCFNTAMDKRSFGYAKEQPKKLILELTASCNLSCKMCGNSNHKPGYRPEKTMSLNQLEKIAQELFHHASWIRLNGFGESTIIPEFLKYLKIIETYRAGSNLELTTNLTIKNDELWIKLVELGTVLLISCDGSSAELQGKIRRGCDWKKFTSNLTFVEKQIQKYGFPEQSLLIFTAQPENINDLTNIVSLANEYGVFGIIVNMVNTPTALTWMQNNYNSIFDSFKQAKEIAEEINVDLRLPQRIGQKDINLNGIWKIPQKNCQNPWEEVNIRYNGDLTVCNMFNPYCYGNMLIESFEEVWNGINARFFRGMMLENIVPPFCTKCFCLVDST